MRDKGDDYYLAFGAMIDMVAERMPIIAIWPASAPMRCTLRFDHEETPCENRVEWVVVSTVQSESNELVDQTAAETCGTHLLGFVSDVVQFRDKQG